ncbi:hypothetical protein FRC08_011134 [Ceratobasidium sp. 394]|nr:hypothetical protein FRC08_011134 [Ceratobasidium sp. 394]
MVRVNIGRNKPRNGFHVFLMKVSQGYQARFPGEIWHESTLAKVVRRWSRMSEEKRAPYEALAERPPSSLSLESYHTTSDCTQEDEDPAADVSDDDEVAQEATPSEEGVSAEIVVVPAGEP